MKQMLCILAITAIFLSTATCVYCEESARPRIGVVARIGKYVPLDLIFRDETGNPVKLSSVVTKPTILSFVYYGCDRFCPLMLGGLASSLGGMNLKPGDDYQIATISIDENDIPSMARESKANYIKAAGLNFPESAWKFLTGSKESIQKITDSTGYKFSRESHGFIHPEVLIILSSEGKIIRYLNAQKIVYGQQYPVIFSSVELTDSLKSAAKGRVMKVSQAAPQICFPHEPLNQEKFFRLLTVAGWVSVFSLVFFFLYLKITSRKF